MMEADADRVSLLSVSVPRLPWYLILFSVIVIISAIGAITTVSGAFWAATHMVTAQISSTSAATVAMLLAFEGVCMGITKMFIEKARAEGREQGRAEGLQDGIKEERKRWEKAGHEMNDGKPCPNKECTNGG